MALWASDSESIATKQKFFSFPDPSLIKLIREGTNPAFPKNSINPSSVDWWGMLATNSVLGSAAFLWQLVSMMHDVILGCLRWSWWSFELLNRFWSEWNSIVDLEWILEPQSSNHVDLRACEFDWLPIGLEFSLSWLDLELPMWVRLEMNDTFVKSFPTERWGVNPASDNFPSSSQWGNAASNAAWSRWTFWFCHEIRILNKLPLFQDQAKECNSFRVWNVRI